MAKIRTCLVCGEQYKFCPHCEEFKDQPTWKVIFHDENCKTLYDTVARFYSGSITADEAIKAIKGCDLSRRDCWNSKLRKNIDAILDKSKSEEKTTEKKEVKGYPKPTKDDITSILPAETETADTGNSKFHFRYKK